jgi:hypothetical protein
MGIQINGQTDIISAIDGGLTVSGADLGSASASSLNISGIVTASGFSGNVNATGLSTFSGGVVVAAGTAAAPSISPTGNSNTGIFFPSADTVAIAEGGVEALIIHSSSNIGIGTTNPLTKVHIQGTGNGSSGSTGLSDSSSASALLLKPIIGSGTALALGTRNTGGHYIQGLYAASSVESVRDVQINPYGGSVGIGTFADAFGGSPGSSTFVVATTGLERLRIDSSGRVTKPYQPAFFAYPNTGSSLGGVQTYVFSLTQFNIGSHYSTATGRFTAPVAGVYHFDYGVQHNASVSDNLAVDLNVNNSQYSSVVRIEVFTSSTFHIVTASATIYLNASDFVTIASITGTAWGDNSWFSGHHVG